MAGYQNLLVERDGSLGRITLNRPERRNPLDRETAEKHYAALEKLYRETLRS